MEKFTELQRFAERLNEVFDDMKIPAKGKGRQDAVAKHFKVSQGGARKWLEAEAYPTLDKIEQIVRWANVSWEWLMTGRGAKRLMIQEGHPAYLDEREKVLLDNYRSSEEEGARAIERLALSEAAHAQRKEAPDAHSVEIKKTA